MSVEKGLPSGQREEKEDWRELTESQKTAVRLFLMNPLLGMKKYSIDEMRVQLNSIGTNDILRDPTYRDVRRGNAEIILAQILFLDGVPTIMLVTCDSKSEDAVGTVGIILQKRALEDCLRYMSIK